MSRAAGGHSIHKPSYTCLPLLGWLADCLGSWLVGLLKKGLTYCWLKMGLKLRTRVGLIQDRHSSALTRCVQAQAADELFFRTPDTENKTGT